MDQTIFVNSEGFWEVLDHSRREVLHQEGELSKESNA